MGDFFVLSAFLGMFFSVFPIFLTVNGYVDVRSNKIFYSISLYGFLRVFGGYMQLDKEGIVVHLTKKKAVFVPFHKMMDTRKKFEITKGFQLYKFHQVIETGSVNAPVSVLFVAALQAVSGQIFSILQTKRPFLSLRNNTVLSDESTVKITLSAVTVFNGMVLGTAISKKILEGVLKWIRTKSLTASWKKRRNSSPASST